MSTCSRDNNHTKINDVQKGWGVLSFNGKVIIPCKYNEIRTVDEDVVVVKVGDRWGLLNINGTEITQPLYRYIGYRFSENRILVGGKSARS